MGVRQNVMEGSRKKARGSPVMFHGEIPGSYKGHFSMKSSPYRTGFSSSLGDELLIQKHMIAHYSKILSAQARVDCSPPKYMNYKALNKDHQKQEMMRRAGVKSDKETSASLNSLRNNGRSTSQNMKDTFFTENDVNEKDSNISQNDYMICARPLSALIQQHNNTKKTAQHNLHSCTSPFHTSSARRRPFSSQACSHAASSSVRYSTAYRGYRDPLQTTYGGDLIEKHPHMFKDTNQPFTPRTLKKDSKSILKQCRYYNPPRRKAQPRALRKQSEEKEIQVSLDSLLDVTLSTEAKNLSDAEWVLKQAEYADETWVSDELEYEQICIQSPHSSSSSRSNDRLEDLDQRHSLPRTPSTIMKSASVDKIQTETPSTVMKSASVDKIQTEEEELKYLEFIASVTNEILMLGLFSNRVIKLVFDRHIEQNRHLLNEEKMRHLLSVLCEDLGCKNEECFETPDDYSTFGVPGISYNSYSQKSITLADQMRKDYADAMLLDSSAVLQNETEADTWQCFLPPDKSSLLDSDGLNSLQTILNDEHSETPGWEEDVLNILQADERQESLNTEEPLLNSAVSEELDELPQTFAESLHIDSGKTAAETPDVEDRTD